MVSSAIRKERLQRQATSMHAALPWAYPASRVEMCSPRLAPTVETRTTGDEHHGRC